MRVDCDRERGLTVFEWSYFFLLRDFVVAVVVPGMTDADVMRLVKELRAVYGCEVRVRKLNSFLDLF